jgi:hypothetical protein
VRQAQQEQLAFTERVYAIQTMLGERTLANELSRQAAIARGAAAGSQTQLKALEQVAQQTKALSEQAKQFLGQALSASDELARKAGREAPVLVSKEQLAQDAAERQRQLEEAQRVFDTGGQISREDFQALAGGGLEGLRDQKRAGQSALAGEMARTSVARGRPLSDFLSPGGTPDPAAAFAEQINTAFTSPMDLFEKQVGTQFASVVAKAGPHFAELSVLWGEAVDAMVKKAESGSSKMGAALYETFKAKLTKDLEREVKTF